MDCELVETEALTSFIDENVDAYLPSRSPHRARSFGALEDHLCPECKTKLATAFAALQIAADLRQVDAMNRSSMQVDADVAARDYLIQKEVRDACSERAVGRAGKRAVEIAPVGQIRATGL